MKRPVRKTSASIKSRFGKVNGVRLRYLAAREGEPVILLYGYVPKLVDFFSC